MGIDRNKEKRKGSRLAKWTDHSVAVEKERSRTYVRVDRNLSQERDIRRNDGRARARPLLPDATLRHVEVNILVFHRKLRRGRGDTELVSVCPDPAQTNLSTLPDNLTQLARKLYRTLSRHNL